MEISTCSVKVSLKYIEVVANYLSGRAYIGEVDTNLVDIRAEISELLDKQVYVYQMSVSNRNSGIHVGVMQAHEEYS